MNDFQCNICQGRDAVFYCRKDSIDVFSCRNCGHKYVNGAPNYKEMEGHYSQEYFQPYIKSEDTHLRKRFKKRIAEIKKIRFPGVLLDAGCGAGTFLKLAQDEGYKAFGVELSRWACEYASNNFCLDVYNGDLKGAPYLPETFDVITLWHVLEHINDPKSLLARAHKLLKPKGLLALEVPNIASLPAKISGVDWELMAPKEHFSYFSPRAIEMLLEYSGFRILKQQSYLWTTPAMFFKAQAKKSGRYMQLILRLAAALSRIFSFLRFRAMPDFLKGDIITVYAVKVEGSL